MTPSASRAEFSAALDEARRARHLSIRSIARLAEVPSATVQGWLSGKHFPTPALRPHYLALVEELGMIEQLPADLFDEPWRAAPAGAGRRGLPNRKPEGDARVSAWGNTDR